MRGLGLTAILLGGLVPALSGQAICGQPSAICHQQSARTADGGRRIADRSFEQFAIHNGKWLAAAGVAAFTVAAASEHRLSRREWNALLIICRSAQDACAVGANGRYLRPDAEARFQRSRDFDRRANRWLVGAQLTLIVTTALFIIDLHPGRGPENIPLPASRIELGPVGDGVGLGMRLAF